jgi:rSAM/selenodomain-associated transferase 2
MMTSISVVIPTYNEQDQIASTIAAVRAASLANLEIVIADGGSTDNTLNIAASMQVRILKCTRKGRGPQMNQGAGFASGNLLYFLHADSIPPAGFDTKILAAINSGHIAGCFRLKFDHRHWFLRANAWFTRFNVNAVRFGDQSLFILKEKFLLSKGFREDLVVMEDQEIIHRLRRLGKFCVINDYVTTSARKYLDNGVYRMQGIFYLIWSLYYIGISQRNLVSVYKKLIRKHKLS